MNIFIHCVRKDNMGKTSTEKKELVSKETKKKGILKLRKWFDFDVERRCRIEMEKNKDCIEILWYLRRV